MSLDRNHPAVRYACRFGNYRAAEKVTAAEFDMPPLFGEQHGEDGQST